MVLSLTKENTPLQDQDILFQRLFLEGPTFSEVPAGAGRDELMEKGKLRKEAYETPHHSHSEASFLGLLPSHSDAPPLVPSPTFLIQRPRPSFCGPAHLTLRLLPSHSDAPPLVPRPCLSPLETPPLILRLRPLIL